MVAKKVEIRSLSYKEGAEAVRWECDGSPEFTMEKTDKAERGTDIILHIDDENKNFLQQSEIDSLLRKYCRFLPVLRWCRARNRSGRTARWWIPTVTRWLTTPSRHGQKSQADLTDEDYRNFYHQLYPGQEDPLFWIHLNVDYPFTLNGVLFFPKIKNNFEVNKTAYSSTAIRCM